MNESVELWPVSIAEKGAQLLGVDQRTKTSKASKWGLGRERGKEAREWKISYAIGKLQGGGRGGRERERGREDMIHLLLVNMLPVCTVSYTLHMTSNSWYAAQRPWLQTLDSRKLHPPTHSLTSNQEVILRNQPLWCWVSHQEVHSGNYGHWFGKNAPPHYRDTYISKKNKSDYTYYY